MVSTRNKTPRNYRAPQRIDGSGSASGAMVHSIRHTRRVANSSAAPTNEGSRTADDASQTTPVDASQTTLVVEAPPIEPPKKRGRKPGSRTKFKQPPRGVKVVLKPEGDE
jgi:hypothetical protein